MIVLDEEVNSFEHALCKASEYAWKSDSASLL
jgi:hypothetical protein